MTDEGTLAKRRRTRRLLALGIVFAVVALLIVSAVIGYLVLEQPSGGGMPG